MVFTRRPTVHTFFSDHKRVALQSLLRRNTSARIQRGARERHRAPHARSVAAAVAASLSRPRKLAMPPCVHTADLREQQHTHILCLASNIDRGQRRTYDCMPYPIALETCRNSTYRAVRVGPVRMVPGGWIEIETADTSLNSIIPGGTRVLSFKGYASDSSGVEIGFPPFHMHHLHVSRVPRGIGRTPPSLPPSSHQDAQPHTVLPQACVCGLSLRS